MPQMSPMLWLIMITIMLFTFLSLMNILPKSKNPKTKTMKIVSHQKKISW